MRTSCQNVKFTVETAGHFDLDADVKLWLSSHHQPTTLELGRGGDVSRFVQTIASHVCRLGSLSVVPGSN